MNLLHFDGGATIYLKWIALNWQSRQTSALLHLIMGFDERDVERSKVAKAISKSLDSLRHTRLDNPWSINTLDILLMGYLGLA